MKKPRYVSVRLTEFQWGVVLGALGCVQALGWDHEAVQAYREESEGGSERQAARALRAIDHAHSVIAGKLGEWNAGRE